jgi:hypothetical protein
VALVASALAVIVSLGDALTGTTSKTKAIGPSQDNARELGELLFTRYAFAFEITGVLLTIAVVAAVVFARKVKGELQDVPSSALDEINARGNGTTEEAAKIDEGAKGRSACSPRSTSRSSGISSSPPASSPSGCSGC